MWSRSVSGFPGPLAVGTVSSICKSSNAQVRATTTNSCEAWNRCVLGGGDHLHLGSDPVICALVANSYNPTSCDRWYRVMSDGIFQRCCMDRLGDRRLRRSQVSPAGKASISMAKVQGKTACGSVNMNVLSTKLINMIALTVNPVLFTLRREFSVTRHQTSC